MPNRNPSLPSRYSTASKKRWRTCSAGQPANHTDKMSGRTFWLALATILIASAHPAAAQDISVNFGQGSGLTERVVQLVALLTVLSVAPSILVMVTSFTRIVVVLSLLRTALGTATAPPNAVLISLAMFLTAFVMWPTFLTAYDGGVKPLMANE